MGKEVLVTGGTGFIGRVLCRRLVENGYGVTVLSREPEAVPRLCGEGVRGVRSFSDLGTDACFDAVVNLAGAPIADRRWSEARKAVLEKSRIGLTDDLINWMAQLKVRPKVLVSGSAVGFYGAQGENEVDETTAPNDEYQHRLCRDWERAALRAGDLGVRVCILRTGLVVGKGGGFLKKMLPPFRLGLGGPIGEGRQWMPWVHMEDLTGLILFLIEHEELSGAFNGTAPEPVTNREFAHALGRALHRPAFLPLPAFFLKTVFGEMSRLLLTGQRAIPRAAINAGYRFRYTTLDAALNDVLQ